jgi:hypothetical protein
LALPSLHAAWAATAAVTSAYAPVVGRPFGGASDDPDAVLDRAAELGDAHAIKFADAALDAWRRDGDPGLLAAADNATTLIRDD